ncbi:hypothetical protein JTB14_031798 [Gonioctena quinquepunctata]|nr:hypothetical protein JTB14_031798 [Gonioctena quinquepunctata]
MSHIVAAPKLSLSRSWRSHYFPDSTPDVFDMKSYCEMSNIFFIIRYQNTEYETNGRSMLCGEQPFCMQWIDKNGSGSTNSLVMAFVILIFSTQKSKDD